MRLPSDSAAPRAALAWALAALLSAPLCAHAGQGGSRSDNSSQGSGNGAASKNDSEMTTIVFRGCLHSTRILR